MSLHYNPTQVVDNSSGVKSVLPNVFAGETTAKTYDFSSVVNYAASDEYDASEDTSGVIGDGDVCPYFYVVGTDMVSALATTGTSLKLTMTADASGPWPDEDTAPSPTLIFPMPWPHLLDVKFTLKSNFPGLGTGAGGSVRFGIYSVAYTDAVPKQNSIIDWTYFLSHPREHVTLYSNVYGESGASVESWNSAGIITKTYQFTANDGSVCIKGAAPSSTNTTTLLNGRRNANFAGINRLFIVGLGATITGAGLYVEVSDMTITAKRSSL